MLISYPTLPLPPFSLHTPAIIIIIIIIIVAVSETESESARGQGHRLTDRDREASRDSNGRVNVALSPLALPETHDQARADCSHACMHFTTERQTDTQREEAARVWQRDARESE